MDTGQVIVATMTWARSEKEETVLRASLTSLAACGLPVTVADAGARPDFHRFLETLPKFSVTVPSGSGLIAQIQASLQIAATGGSPFILYTEPDKRSFFEQRLMDFLRAAAEHADAGVILAARSRESFLTFPPMQQYTEGVINRLCGELIGIEGDYSYGPFLMNSALVPGPGELEPRLGWGWRHFLFRMAHSRGYRVVPLTGDYPCPDGERTEDDAERAHRMRQLSQNVLGLID